MVISVDELKANLKELFMDGEIEDITKNGIEDLSDYEEESLSSVDEDEHWAGGEEWDHWVAMDLLDIDVPRHLIADILDIYHQKAELFQEDNGMYRIKHIEGADPSKIEEIPDWIATLPNGDFLMIVRDNKGEDELP